MSEPREELHRVLTDWRGGQRQSREVREWAEAREDESWTDDAVVQDIVGHIAIADINLTTPDEIPLLLQMLQVSEVEAFELAEHYGSEQDMAAVKEKWKGDPFYGPFCRKENAELASAADGTASHIARLSAPVYFRRSRASAHRAAAERPDVLPRVHPSCRHCSENPCRA